MKIFRQENNIAEIMREIVTMIMFHIGIVRGNGERLCQCTCTFVKTMVHVLHVRVRVSYIVSPQHYIRTILSLRLNSLSSHRIEII